MLGTSGRLGILLMVALLLVMPLLAACGDDGEESTPLPTGTPTQTEPSTPSPTATGQPVPTGTLTIAVALINTDKSMSPFTRSAGDARAYYSMMADYLLHDDPDGSGFIPGLAEEWEIAPDEMSVTFKLRQGVQFHDGWGELTAEDVKFTLEAATDSSISTYQVALTHMAPYLDRIETSGPYEVTIHLNKPLADEVLYYLTPAHNLALAITSKAYYDEVGLVKASQSPIYSGPYRFVEFEMADKLVMEAVENHWRVVPEFKTLVFREVPELITRVAMIETGEADIATVTIEQAQHLQGRGFEIVRVPEAYYLHLALLGQWLPSVETYDPELPWLDKRVREAMNLAINREEIAELFYSGFAVPIAGIFPTPWAEALEPYPYDPDRAEELLLEAGYGDGFKVEMWDLSTSRMSPEMSELMLLVASYWETLGLDLEITPYNVLAVYGNILTRDTSGVVIGFTWPSRGAPFSGYHRSVSYSQHNTFPMYESEESDRLVEGWLAASTMEERDSYEEQITQYVYDEYAYVPVVAVDAVWAIGDAVGDWDPLNVFTYYLEYATHP